MIYQWHQEKCAINAEKVLLSRSCYLSCWNKRV